MAGDWTKMRDDLASDPAVLAMAKQLDIHPDEVVGKLLRTWAWAGKHTTNGVVRTCSAQTLDIIVGVENFSRALAFVGWLDVDGENTLRFPRWNTHNSKSAKRRCLQQKRMAKKRARNERTSSAQSDDKRRTREEKRREETEESPPSPSPDVSKSPALSPPNGQAGNSGGFHRTDGAVPGDQARTLRQLRALEKLGTVPISKRNRSSIGRMLAGLGDPLTFVTGVLERAELQCITGDQLAGYVYNAIKSEAEGIAHA